MTVVGIVIVLILVAVLVAWPLLRTEKPGYRKALLADDEELAENEKETVFTTINEIEFDYQMNKLSPDDYEILKSQYKQKALEILQDEEDTDLETASPDISKEAKTAADIEDEIEKELQELRKTSAAGKE